MELFTVVGHGPQDRDRSPFKGKVIIRFPKYHASSLINAFVRGCPSGEGATRALLMPIPERSVRA